MNYQKDFLKKVDAHMKKCGRVIKILAIAGPNGAGKTTLIHGLMKKFPDSFCEIDLITTGVPHGNDGPRRFVSYEEFLKEKIVVGWAVGCCESGYSVQDLIKAIRKNKIIIFEGIFRLEKLKDILGEERVHSIIVGVLPPGDTIQKMLDILKIRLQKRRDCCPDDVVKKLLDARNRIIPNILAKSHIILRGGKNRTSSNALVVMKKWKEIMK